LRKLTLSILAAILSLLFVCPDAIPQTADPDIQKILVQRAGFSEDQIAALERHDPVVKLIPSTDRREIAVCGVMEVQSDPETALKAFERSLNQLRQKSMLVSGKFSEQPGVEDVRSLTLSDGDIEDLKQCTVGDCKLKLSAAMIQRFQKSINWKAMDYKEQVNQLFRSIIVEYLIAYLQKGDAALIEYADQSNRLASAREQESLLANLLYVNEAAPEFVRHVKAFPRSSVPVEHSLRWANINLGRKPTIVINDVATYRFNRDDVPRILVLSKQIYASHYLDASISLTAFIGDHKTTSRLLYVNYSRASVLASSFSKLKHQIVEGKATDNLEELLGQTRLNIDVVRNNSPVSFEPGLERTTEWYAMRIIPALGLLTFIGILFNRKALRLRNE